ncbi:hypothetical protein VTI28DRAFT_6198 [Corynascus sepedonium]
MYTKSLVPLVAAALVGQAVAGPHGYGLHHLHPKRGFVTEESTVTHWVTVTVYGDGSTPTPEAFPSPSRKFKLRSSSSTGLTTSDVIQVVPTSAVADYSTISEAKIAVSSTTAPAANIKAPAPVVNADSLGSDSYGGSDSNGGNGGNGGGSGGTGKRGLAYNDANLLNAFLSDGTKVSWTYNWGQVDDSGTGLEFVPTLWGTKLDFALTWPLNAQKAIDAGSKCLFSFNEPELAAQANMSPQVAALKHIALMNPFKGKARIGSPSITNGVGPDHGIEYLKRFFDACGGDCAVDFINIHIYGVDTNTFLSHVRDVHSAFNKPVWITEFAFDGSDDEINSQLETVIDQIENNATYSFVERYAYFMVQDGTMVKNNSPSKYGNTFAYGA